jgi:acyl dehydratase
MPIDLARVVGAELPVTEFSWDEDRVILYHLGLGAGVPPTDPKELAYVYEGSLKVLPTFATVPPFLTMVGVGGLAGLEVNPAMILHGEQQVTIHRPLPVSGSVTNRGRVTKVYDKGKGALLVVEVDSSDGQGRLFTNTSAVFVRGEGGFGGEPGPQPWPVLPERSPDLVVDSPTLPQQALLYRLSGDKNPLHADPGFAAFGGFDRPILHGLSTFGMVCKVVVDGMLAGDTAAVGSFGGRFSGVVFPGEVITTSVWQEAGRFVVSAAVDSRGVRVLSPAVLTVVAGP